MTLNFHYAAYSYLDEYLTIDQRCISALQDGERDKTERCGEALVEMATHYRIIRNLSSKKCDEKFRLSPVLEELSKIKQPQSDDEVVNSVEEFVRGLKKCYGQELTSAASKFLWMRFQSPVVIYDSLAWAALKKRSRIRDSDGYREYLHAWRSVYREVAAEVRSASRDLVSIKRFTLAADDAGGSLNDLIAKEWFCERVFDNWLISSDSGDSRQAASLQWKDG